MIKTKERKDMQFHLIKEIKNIFNIIYFITLGIITFILFLEMKFWANSVSDNLIYIITISLVITLYILYKRFNIKYNAIPNKYFKSIDLSLKTKVFIVFIGVYMDSIMQTFFSSDTANQRLSEKNDEGLSMITVLVGTGLTAPIIEEIIFRGVLFIVILTASSYLQNKNNSEFDILGNISFFLFSFLFFGFLHVAKGCDFENIGGYLVSGFILSLVFVLTRDIKIGIAIHMIINIASVLGRYDYKGIIALLVIIMLIYIFIYMIWISNKNNKIISDYASNWEYRFKKYKARKKLKT
ncbi:CPBP family glutamic-type intramembrane protease [Staphylococcus shinii]|uniref:CPBP family glutamic-type intramembrane protease n=1 Tax=Staphylococcus shinii TaxID=2912228 RepID=UPI003F837EB4